MYSIGLKFNYLKKAGVPILPFNYDVIIDRFYLSLITFYFYYYIKTKLQELKISLIDIP